MKVCIVGWYGTETIGDRGILAGIISFLGKKYNKLEINLGSLYPDYTERMIIEDKGFYEKILGKKLKINLFDSKSKKILKNVIVDSDFVIMGGGPVMHIKPLYMVSYALKYAKKIKKKTGMIGCGIGPLFTKEFKKVTLEMAKNSDIIILRDENSRKNLQEISNELNYNLEKNIEVSYDPAVECALQYLEKRQTKEVKRDKIVVNLRDFPSEYSKKNIKYKVNTKLNKFIEALSLKYQNNEIILVPMHYYFIGTDDREFLNELILKNKTLKNVRVQNEILTLEETMELFYNSFFCIGMRFHSVVLQTILSGRNFILDYTEPKKGKISGFVLDIDKKNFYDDRFLNLQEDLDNEIDVNKFVSNEKLEFSCDIKNIKIRLKNYYKELSKIGENHRNENSSC
ncbi:polysaccharide pyruvyl transferase family protein [uncultured Ilyobacter sp.]|uniref:polysaccharide pyruvyl transferase family protein n=1 Tax=uncultured Ilyobacter sp. TaxID=544433 RepID=UPI0029F52BF8|nr:polysaccharide pyruvyl transferase family protein [uncultured Ilyobacter sp.]